MIKRVNDINLFIINKNFEYLFVYFKKFVGLVPQNSKLQYLSSISLFENKNT